jgi:hypothetical protein
VRIEAITNEFISSKHTLDKVSHNYIRLNKNPKKARKEHNSIKKAQKIRHMIQDSVLYVKLKRALNNKIIKRWWD